MIQNKAAGRELYDSLQVPGTSTEVSAKNSAKNWVLLNDATEASCITASKASNQNCSSSVRQCNDKYI